MSKLYICAALTLHRFRYRRCPTFLKPTWSWTLCPTKRLAVSTHEVLQTRRGGPRRPLLDLWPDRLLRNAAAAGGRRCRPGSALITAVSVSIELMRSMTPTATASFVRLVERPHWRAATAQISYNSKAAAPRPDPCHALHWNCPSQRPRTVNAGSTPRLPTPLATAESVLASSSCKCSCTRIPLCGVVHFSCLMQALPLAWC